MRRRRAAGALPCLLALGALLDLSAGAARASVQIEQYTLDVTPEPGGTVAYHLMLTYRASGEQKSEGFKYVGTDEPLDLRGSTPGGGDLDVRAGLEQRSGEYRVEFAVPPPDAEGRQVVQLDFRQRAALRHGLMGTELQVPWAHKFRVPVDKTRVSVNLSAEQAAALPETQWNCFDSGKGRTCIRVSSRPEPLSLMLPTSGEGLGLLPLGLLLGGGALGLLLRRRQRALLASRGVIPPASPVSYPDAFAAPAPLPATPEPVLPDEERRALRREIALRVGAVAGGALVAALLLVPPVLPRPLGLFFAGWFALGGLLQLAANSTSWPRTVYAVLGVPALVVLAGGSAAVSLGLGLCFAFISFLSWAFSGRSWGSSSTGGSGLVVYSSGSSCSSSSGSSSCGGGGGGSSCGGGGSSCGGGGGGGGCGG